MFLSQVYTLFNEISKKEKQYVGREQVIANEINLCFAISSNYIG